MLDPSWDDVNYGSIMVVMVQLCSDKGKYLRAGTGSEGDGLPICALAGITGQALHHLIGGDADSWQVRALQPVGLALDHMDAAGP